MLKTAKNPAEMMKQMCMQNPQLKQAYDTALSLAGGDPKAAFYTKARQMGLDPDAVIAALNG